MAVRPIDGDAVKRRAWDIAEAWKDQGRDYEALLLESVVEQIVDTQPTLTPPNEPLTLEQLREMDGEPVYVVSAIGERSEWYIVDLEENELKNPWDRIALDNWDERYPYTAYRRPPEGEEET